MFAVADVVRLPLADKSVDLVFGSPPYCDARTYGIGADRECQEWIDWMLEVTTECLRVTRGAVVWVAAGVTRDRNYWPACEGLMYEWWKRGGSMYRPCYWHRVGIPGSGGDQWFRADVEYVMCFKRDGKLPWTDNVAMGHKPRFAIGGALTSRSRDGARADRGHRANPEKANPGNCLTTGASGGGNMGDGECHESEAPFPERLAEFFVRSLCPPGGTVCDPFSGSGTTVSVVERFHRKGIGFDMRMSQCELGKRRMKNLQVELFA